MIQLKQVLEILAKPIIEIFHENVFLTGLLGGELSSEKKFRQSELASIETGLTTVTKTD